MTTKITMTITTATKKNKKKTTLKYQVKKGFSLETHKLKCKASDDFSRAHYKFTYFVKNTHFEIE